MSEPGLILLMIEVEQRAGNALTLRVSEKPSLTEAAIAVERWVLSADPIASHLLIDLETARVDGLITDLREVGLDGFHKSTSELTNPVVKAAWIVPMMSLRTIVELTLDEFLIPRFPNTAFRTFEERSSARQWLGWI